MKIISKELCVKGNDYDIIEAYMEYKNKHFKVLEKEYEDQLHDCRDENVEDKDKYINEKLGEPPIHQLISQLKKTELLWDFDCVSLYPSAMWDRDSMYPKIENGYALEKHMKKELVEKFVVQIFSQGSAILKIDYYKPKNLIVQHLPVKEKEKKIEINRMRNGYITQVLTSVDIQEVVKIGGRVFEIYEGDKYRENFNINPVEKVITNVFALRQKYRKENNEVMQLLVKLIMNALFCNKPLLYILDC